MNVINNNDSRIFAYVIFILKWSSQSLSLSTYQRYYVTKWLVVRKNKVSRTYWDTVRDLKYKKKGQLSTFKSSTIHGHWEMIEIRRYFHKNITLTTNYALFRVKDEFQSMKGGGRKYRMMRTTWFNITRGSWTHNISI